MSYTKPQEVRSPREHWSLIAVLRDGGPGQDSLAIGDWNGQRRLAIRWNGKGDRPAGNPQSRGIATWFMLPSQYNEKVLATLPVNQQELAKTLLEFGE